MPPRARVPCRLQRRPQPRSVQPPRPWVPWRTLRTSLVTRLRRCHQATRVVRCNLRCSRAREADMARLDSFLRMVVDQHGSDLHFHAGSSPIIRYMGDLVSLPYRELSFEETQRFLYEIMTEEQIKVLQAEQELDFAYFVP